MFAHCYSKNSHERSKGQSYVLLKSPVLSRRRNAAIDSWSSRSDADRVLYTWLVLRQGNYEGRSRLFCGLDDGLLSRSRCEGWRPAISLPQPQFYIDPKTSNCRNKKNPPSCHITATTARRRQEQAAQAGGTLLRPRRRQSPRGVPRYIGKASIDAD